MYPELKKSGELSKILAGKPTKKKERETETETETTRIA